MVSGYFSVLLCPIEYRNPRCLEHIRQFIIKQPLNLFKGPPNDYYSGGQNCKWILSFIFPIICIPETCACVLQKYAVMKVFKIQTFAYPSVHYCKVIVIHGQLRLGRDVMITSCRTWPKSKSICCNFLVILLIA